MRTIIMDVIITPLAKFIFLLCIPKKNNGKLISAPILISPPNFFVETKKKWHAQWVPLKNR